MKKSIIDLVNKDRIQKHLAEMIEIPSINPFDNEATKENSEAVFADYLLAKFEDLGLEIGQHEVAPFRSNIWAKFQGTASKSKPSLALIAHTDTVGVEGYKDAFVPKIIDGKMHGRGSCDMKAAFAAFIEVVQVMKEGGLEPDGDLYIIGVADEEYHMIGSKSYPKHGPQVDFGIVGEPTELQICPAHRGQYGFKIAAIGKSVHSGQKHLGQNAIYDSVPLLAMLQEFDKDLQAGTAHPLCGTSTCSTNVINGGTVLSIVPERCEVEIDIRQVPSVTAESVRQDLESRLAKLMETYPDKRYEIVAQSWDIPAHEVPSDSPELKKLADCFEALFSKAPEVVAFPAATDAPNMGFPSVICGPGDLKNAHTTNEFVDIDEVVDAAKLYLTYILDN